MSPNASKFALPLYPLQHITGRTTPLLVMPYTAWTGALLGCTACLLPIGGLVTPLFVFCLSLCSSGRCERLLYVLSLFRSVPCCAVSSREQVRAVQALPDGRLASASQDHTARLWAPKDGASQGAAGGVYYEIGGESFFFRRAEC